MTSGGGSRAAGEIFDDQYELLNDLGSGEFGEVWKAHDLRLDRVVALKLLKDDDQHAAWHEGRTLVDLRSPHILPIYNAGLAIDVPYLVTDYVPGGTVADLIVPRGIAPARAVAITRDVLRGLDLSHQRRVLHRDIKPANIFLRGTGDAQLGDFGVAAIMDAAGTADKHGDLDVRAPEVLKGGRFTAAADVYSVGVSLWAMLVGGLPIVFDPMNGFASHKAAVAAGVPDIREAAPGVSLTLAKVVRRACAVRASDRFSTAADFNNALGKIRHPAADVVCVSPHPDHAECWEVTRISDGHVHTVCVEPMADGTREVVIRHSASGNRVGELCAVTTTRRSELIALRRAFVRLT